jgi:hypothetical protein
VVAPVRDADVSVMPPELVGQYGAWGYRQELSIGAVSTRTRLFGTVVPLYGCDLLLRRLGRVWWSCCMSGVLGWTSGSGTSKRGQAAVPRCGGIRRIDPVRRIGDDDCACQQ